MAPIPVPAKSFAIIQTYHTVAVDSRMAALSTSLMFSSLRSTH